MDRPIMLITRLNRSMMPFGQRATSTARPTASTSETTKAYSSSSAVTGSRAPRIVVTFSPFCSDVPRLPWNMPPSQLP